MIWERIVGNKGTTMWVTGHSPAYVLRKHEPPSFKQWVRRITLRKSIVRVPLAGASYTCKDCRMILLWPWRRYPRVTGYGSFI